MLPTANRTLYQVVRNGLVAAVAGTGAVGGVGVVAYLQARLTVAAPGRVDYVIDGDVGPLEAPRARRVLWLGDSLAAGLGAVAPDVSLPRLVAAAADGRTRLHVYATPGATSRHVVEHQLPALDQLRHGLSEIGQAIDAIGVTVGANDIAAFTSRRRFRANVARILEAAGDIPVVFVSIPQFADAIRLPRPLRTFASWRARWLDVVLRAAAHRHGSAHYACIRRRPAWIRRQHLAHFLSQDRYHPSGAGYAVWADRVHDTFEKALLPTPPPELV